MNYYSDVWFWRASDQAAVADTSRTGPTRLLSRTERLHPVSSGLPYSCCCA